MATETANPEVTAPEAAQARPPTMREALLNAGRMKNSMPAALDRLMKEVAPDQGAGAGGAMARLERRIGVLERAFADIVERHEAALRERSGALTAIEENLSALRVHVERADKHHADAAEELRASLADAGMRLNGLEANRLAGTPGESVANSPALPGAMPMWTGELDAVPCTDAASAPPEAENGVQRISESQSYLLAARRAAKAAVAPMDEMSVASAKSPRRSSRTRLLVFGCAAPLMVVAAAVFVLNRHSVTAKPVAGSAPAVTKPQPIAVLSPPPDVVLGLPADPTAAEISSSLPLAELEAKAKAGDVIAERDAGLKYLTGDGIQVNEEEAARWLLSAAYRGEPAAEYWLGTLYARGRGVPEDEDQANHWYEAAAKQGNRNAMHSFAVAYFEGRGREKDEAEAARWFAKAAELGFVDSQFNLAVLYERGAGVPASLAEAYKWYAIASAQGDKEASARVAALGMRLMPSELAGALRAAREFQPKEASRE